MDDLRLLVEDAEGSDHLMELKRAGKQNYPWVSRHTYGDSITACNSMIISADQKETFIASSNESHPVPTTHHFTSPICFQINVERKTEDEGYSDTEQRTWFEYVNE